MAARKFVVPPPQQKRGEKRQGGARRVRVEQVDREVGLAFDRGLAVGDGGQDRRHERCNTLIAGNYHSVTPAKAGVQWKQSETQLVLDSRVRGNDGSNTCKAFYKTC